MHAIPDSGHDRSTSHHEFRYKAIDVGIQHNFADQPRSAQITLAERETTQNFIIEVNFPFRFPQILPIRFSGLSLLVSDHEDERAPSCHSHRKFNVRSNVATSTNQVVERRSWSGPARSDRPVTKIYRCLRSVFAGLVSRIASIAFGARSQASVTMAAVSTASTTRSISQIMKAARRTSFTKVFMVCSSGCVWRMSFESLNEAYRIIPLDDDRLVHDSM